MISKCLSTSERYASLEQHAGKLAEFCQALYPLLVAHADDHGRQAGDEFTVKHLVHPTSKRKLEDFTAALLALHESGLIAWYQVNGAKFLQIEQFDAHQTGLHKRSPSKVPVNPGDSGNPWEFPLKRTEQKGTEQKGTRDSSEVNSEPPAPAVLTFPVVGAQTPEWALTEGQVRDWRALFPTVDVVGEARKALAWIGANPGKRKTPGGMPKFLVAWLSRATNSHGGLVRDGPLSAAGQSTKAAAERAKATMRGQA